jgi:hypothetical protein
MIHCARPLTFLCTRRFWLFAVETHLVTQVSNIFCACKRAVKLVKKKHGINCIRVLYYKLI